MAKLNSSFILLLSIGLLFSSCYKNDNDLSQATVIKGNDPIFKISGEWGNDVFELEAGRDDYVIDINNDNLNFWNDDLQSVGTKIWNSEKRPWVFINFATPHSVNSLLQKGEYDFLTYNLPENKGVELSIVTKTNYYSTRHNNEAVQADSYFRIIDIQTYKDSDYLQITMETTCTLYDQDESIEFKNATLVGLFKVPLVE